MDLSSVEVIDFHSHLPRKYNISQHLGAGEEPRAIFELPGTSQNSFLKYLSRVYDCECKIEQIDRIISKRIELDFHEYVRSILDRENIRLVNLDFFGRKAPGELDVGVPQQGKRAYSEDFPPDRYVWTYGTTNIIQPSWLRERGAETLDQALKLIDDDLDDAVNRDCRALKSMIAYYRPLRMERVEQNDAERAYKSIIGATHRELRSYHGWFNVPVYDDPGLKNNLETVQDFLIRHLLIYAGEHRLPFEFHVGSIDMYSQDQRNNNPADLFSLFYDEAVMKTDIVILHAGYPFYQQAGVLPLQFYSRSKNIYIDISYVSHFFSPAGKDVLTSILTFAPPDRILFGTDAGMLADYEAYYTWTAKTMLAEILEELARKYLWTESDCLNVANMVFNENAKRLLRI